MANLFDLKNIRNKPHRDGFDLSKRNSFSAKVGEILPIWWRLVQPGDVFENDCRSFTRTVPVNSPAFTRIREYYDFFFVPCNLIWNRFNQYIIQTQDNAQSAYSINLNNPVPDEHPYFTIDQLKTYYTNMQSQQVAERNNMFGFQRDELTRKLLSYLGYGDMQQYVDKRSEEYVNYKLNPFPLLAYQKIYQDYFRNSQWEKSQSNTWNINYAGWAQNSLQLPIDSLDLRNENMFDIKYANWNKDMFMGVLPNSQFGDAASVDLSSLLSLTPTDDFDGVGTMIAQTSNPGPFPAKLEITDLNPGLVSVNGVSAFRSSFIPSELAKNLGLSPENLQNAFTVLALRKAEAAQKWAEVTQSHSQDYKNQIEAHFGVSPSDAYSDRCRWIGGYDTQLDIDEVMNQNLATTKDEADIRGKGVGVGRGQTKFQCDIHGIIMCVYHAVPLLDYSLSTGIRPELLKTKATDYAIPEYDQTGMTSVLSSTLSNLLVNQDGEPFHLGYAPRYYEYKTDFDEINGIFKYGGYDAWVAPVSEDYLLQWFGNISEQSLSGYVDYRFFKVNPAVVNTIFSSQASSSVESDVLLVNWYIDCKAVRNLDRDGLPY